jgi:hypothetical protein
MPANIISFEPGFGPDTIYSKPKENIKPENTNTLFPLRPDQQAMFEKRLAQNGVMAIPKDALFFRTTDPKEVATLGVFMEIAIKQAVTADHPDTLCPLGDNHFEGAAQPYFMGLQREAMDANFSGQTITAGVDGYLVVMAQHKNRKGVDEGIDYGEKYTITRNLILNELNRLLEKTGRDKVEIPEE